MDPTALIWLMVTHILIAVVLRIFLKSVHVILYVLFAFMFFVFLFGISYSDVADLLQQLLVIVV